jgi:hypothetical protein
MKPEDIQVGKHYIHPSFPGCTWIGAGSSKDPWWNEGFNDKCLVLVQNTASNGSDLGSIFRKPDETGLDILQNIWNGFQEKPTDKSFNDELDELNKERNLAKEKLDAVDRKILETVTPVYNEIASNRLAVEDMIHTLMEHLDYPNNILESIYKDQSYRGSKL